MKYILISAIVLLPLPLSSQSLSTGLGFGYLMPFNRTDFLEGNAGPHFINVSTPSPNLLLNVVYKPNNNYYWELMFTAYSQQITGRYQLGPRRITMLSGNTSKYVSLSLGKAVAKNDRSSLYVFGAVALEYAESRFTSYPRDMYFLKLYDVKKRLGYFPHIQSGLNWQWVFGKRRKSSTLTVQLMGNLGMIYTRFYYFSVLVEGEQSDVLVKSKNDFVNFAVRYNYDIWQKTKVSSPKL